LGQQALTETARPAAPRGRFITVEGGEGAGKSTQVDLLVAALRRIGIAVERTREPGGSPGGEAVRALLLGGTDARWDAIAETLLFYAARRDHVIRLIEPALAAGRWVVCDRFSDSTIAYQGYGRGLPLADLYRVHQFALGDFAPDLTLVLDLPVPEGLARIAGRSGDADRFERLGHEFHERLRQGFRRIAEDNPGRCVLIDAARSPDHVHKAMCSAVAQRLQVNFGT
jgi:dTMP kinase